MLTNNRNNHSPQFSSSDQSPQPLSPLQTRHLAIQREFLHWNCLTEHAVRHTEKHTKETLSTGMPEVTQKKKQKYGVRLIIRRD